jgi:hypothetical protein
VSSHKRALLLAAVSLLVLAAPAHALRCRDVFSKVDQKEPLAPFVVGDSVTVPAGDYLGEMGFKVNAVACRTFAQGLAVMSGTRLPDLVVMALGTNGSVSGEELNAALELVGPFARLMLVLPKDLGGRPDPDVRLMRAFEQAHPDQITTVDWPAYSAGHGDWFQPDHLHLTTDGAHGFAQMIGEAVEFSPPEKVEPPPEPKQAAPKQPAQPQGDPVVASLWVSLGDALVAVVAPAVDLIGRLLVDPDELEPDDL